MMGDNMEKETKKQTKKQMSNAMTKKKGSSNSKTTSSKKTNNTKTTKGATKKATKVVEKKVKEKEVKKVDEVNETLVPSAKEIKPKKEKNNKKTNKVVESLDVETKESKKEDEGFYTENNEITNLIKIVIVVTLVFLLFYLVTWIITNSKKDSNTETESGEVTISYDTIMMSNMFNQIGNSYYVLAFDEEDLYLSSINSFISTYSYSADVRFYYSNLSQAFNSSYYDKEAETSNLNANELKLNKTTLFKISNGRIEKTYEGGEAILDFLVSVVK